MPAWSPRSSPSLPLSEEQLRGLLKRYDSNGDGRLSKNELKTAFRSLGLRFSSWRAGRALRHADANGDGFISDEEINELVRYATTRWGSMTSKDASVPKSIDKSCPRAPWQPVSTDIKRVGVVVTEDQVRGIFNRFDANKDGRLSKQELKDAFASLGSRMPGFRAWLALQHADANGDGYISEDEFEKLVKYTLKRGYIFK
ncbi:hypothetical protein POUND7_018555 [Theobroma cacao]